MYHAIHTRFELPLPVEAVFPFFAEAANLERITPPELRFKVLSALPIEMRLGTILEYRLSLFGVPFRWKTETSVWDHVRYRLPLSPLSEVILPLVKRELTHIFSYRQAAVTAALLGEQGG